MTNVMIDIETLATTTDAVVLSIGAVKFNEDDVWKHFQVELETRSQIFHGRNVDPDTVKWHHENNTLPTGDMVSVYKGLACLKKFIDEDDIVWANGTSFDISIIEHISSQANITMPWKFYNVRDFRTIKNIFNDVEKPINSNAHNALADAENQALHLIEINKIHQLNLFGELDD